MVGYAAKGGRMVDSEAGALRQEAFEYYPKLGKVRDFCESRFAERIDLQRAADVAALQKNYFSEFFHEKTGMCFSCWLAYVRVEQAKSLLRKDNRLVGLVARDVGFTNLTSFERSFKRFTGMTPSNYKKKVRP